MNVKHWFLPYSPDLLGLLLAQSDITCRGIEAFVQWSGGDLQQNKAVRKLEHEADDARRKVLTELRAAFSTPLDPEDIYELSERLDEVLNGAKNAVRESEIMKVPPDAAMAEMAGHLRTGVGHLHRAFEVLKSDRDVATSEADRAIHCERDLEHCYRRAMSELSDVSDLKEVTGRRELYRRYSRIGDQVVRVGHRVWYLVVKEG
ncbi:MAG: DUF47 domain-containing protein [Acidimicrobiia bacterium]